MSIKQEYLDLLSDKLECLKILGESHERGHECSAATDIDRFSSEDFSKEITEYGKRAASETAKLLMALRHGSISNAHLSITKDLINALAEMFTRVERFPVKLGRTCRRELHQSAMIMIDHAINFISFIKDTVEEDAEDVHDEEETSRPLMTRCAYLIESIDRLIDCPTTNILAANKVFTSQIAVFEDVIQEIKYLLDISTEKSSLSIETCPEERGTSLSDIVEGYSDDEQPLDSYEMVIAAKVSSLINLGIILLKKINCRLLTESSEISMVELIDELVADCEAIGPILDDLGISCHSPQSQQDLTTYSREFVRIILRMCDLIKPRVKEFEWYEKCIQHLNSKLLDLLDHVPCR